MDDEKTLSRLERLQSDFENAARDRREPFTLTDNNKQEVVEAEDFAAHALKIRDAINVLAKDDYFSSHEKGQVLSTKPS